MPFGVVSVVGRGTGVLDGSGVRRRERGTLEANLGCPIVTSGDSNALFPNYFGGGLVSTANNPAMEYPASAAWTSRALQDGNKLSYRPADPHRSALNNPVTLTFDLLISGLLKRLCLCGLSTRIKVYSEQFLQILYYFVIPVR